MKYKIPFLFLLTLMMTILQAEEIALPEVQDVIQLSDFQGELTNEFFEGEHPEIALELKEGMILPVRFVINWGFLTIEDFPSLKLRVRKSCWIRFTDEDGYFSYDLKKWKCMDDQGCIFCTESTVKFDQKSHQFTIQIDEIKCECDDDWCDEHDEDDCDFECDH